MSEGLRVLLVPAFNEAPRIEAVLREAANVLPDYRIVVVDDGSWDATAEIARACGARVLCHPFNLGYGAALHSGYKYASRAGADLLVQMDADGQHDPRQIPRLVASIRRGDADLVVGSRFLGEGTYRMGVARRLARRLFQAAVRIFGLRITDPTSGFQAMNQAVLELYVREFFPTDYPDVDVLLAAHRHGLRIEECPVSMQTGVRATTLHAGLAPIYYVYKMLLSIWATSLRGRR